MTKIHLINCKLLQVLFVVALMLRVFNFANCQTVNRNKNVVPIDLGLPSGCLWSEMNLGALSCEKSGSFFYWGVAEPCKKGGRYKYGKDYYYTGGGKTKYLKYVTNKEYGTVDGKTNLEPEDDAAAVMLGDLWSIPSLSDFEELLEYCSWKETYRNNVQGIEFVGPNGNSIFFPVTGHFDDSYGLLIGDSSYWSKSLDTEDGNDNAYALIIKQVAEGLEVSIDFNYRTDGGLIRPVKHIKNYIY